MKASHLILILTLSIAANSIFAQDLASPNNGAANIISRTQLLISWEDNSNNEDGFVITDKDATIILGAVPANTESVPVTGLTPGETVQFRIYAYFGQPQRITQISNSYALTPLILMADGAVTNYGHQATVGQDDFSVVLYTDDFDAQDSAIVTGLPGWATFDEDSRTVFGKPTSEGVHSLSLVVNYSNGFRLEESVLLRVVVGPEASSLPSPEYYTGTGVQNIDLNSYFIDPDCSRAARIKFNVGEKVDVVLYEDATPGTVSNFLKYVSEDDEGQIRYEGAMIHRSVPGFVIQGGGFRPAGGSDFERVNSFGTVTNEPGLENVRGTLSMAKIGGNPNSATNQWFVNLRDNRPNLDSQNGGFTVFARVADKGIPDEGMDVIDRISSLPIGDYDSGTHNITVDGVPNGNLMNECPMIVDTQEAPETMEQDKLVVIETAFEIDPLEYEIVSNSDSSVAQATEDDGILQVTPLKSGSCTLKVEVADLDGNKIEEDITITVLNWTFNDWSAAQGLDAGQAGMLDDADGDLLSNFIEYALFGDSTTSTPSLTKSQKVSKIGDGSDATSIMEDYLGIEFSTRNGIEDTLVCVEAVDQLSSNTIWTEIWNSSQGPSAAQVHSVDAKADHTDWVIRDTKPNSSSESRFMRVRVEHVDP